MATKKRTEKPYIICTGTNGRCVVYGYAPTEPITGQPATLSRARMVLYWSAACGGLFGLAARGPQDGTRLTDTVDQTACDKVAQWLTVSPEAAQAMESWPTYRG